MATLYHWDLPQALEDEGGWLNRDTVDRVRGVRRDRRPSGSADRVEHWIPVNEPNVVTMLGLRHRHARAGPGAAVRRAAGRPPPAARPRPRGHRAAGRRARAASAAPTTTRRCGRPATTRPTSGPSKLFDALWNGMFAEPMLFGRYPADLAAAARAGRSRTATWRRSGSRSTSTASTTTTRCGSRPPTEDSADAVRAARASLGYPTTDFGWPVVPDALREWLITLRARYRAALPPIIITESGCSYATGPDANGVVDDQARIDYLDAHLRAVAVAIARRRRRPRLLHLVADGQLRVGRGLHPALRPGARRLRDPGADPEAVLRLVRRDDPAAAEQPGHPSN